jgi:hypothetical protein
MVLTEYLNEGECLMFEDEKKRCLSSIKIGFDRIFGINHNWEVDENLDECLSDFAKTETDGIYSREYYLIDTYDNNNDYFGDSIASTSRAQNNRNYFDDSIASTSRALLQPGRYLEEIKSETKNTTEKFYASINYDFGIQKHHKLNKTIIMAQISCKSCSKIKNSINNNFFKEGSFIIMCNECMDKKFFSSIWTKNQKIMFSQIN